MDAVLSQCNVKTAMQTYKQLYILNQRSSQVNTVTNSITKAITNTYSTSNIKNKLQRFSELCVFNVQHMVIKYI